MKIGTINHVYQTSLVAVVSPTDSPWTVCNCCVFEHFCGVFVMSLCCFEYSVGKGAFVIGLSQISSFFSVVKLCLIQVLTVSTSNQAE